jgi:hypothetical protein
MLFPIHHSRSLPHSASCKQCPSLHQTCHTIDPNTSCEVEFHARACCWLLDKPIAKYITAFCNVKPNCLTDRYRLFDEPDISIWTAEKLRMSNTEDVHRDPHHVTVCQVTWRHNMHVCSNFISADALL